MMGRSPTTYHTLLRIQFLSQLLNDEKMVGGCVRPQFKEGGLDSQHCKLTVYEKPSAAIDRWTGCIDSDESLIANEEDQCDDREGAITYVD